MSPSISAVDALPLQQSPAYARTLRALGRHTDMVQQQGVGRMLMTGMQTRFGLLRMTGRGPLWDGDDASAQVDFLRRYRPMIINDEASDPAVLRRAGYVQVMTPAHLAVLPLTGDPIGRASQKWRNAWRRAGRAGLTIKSDVYDCARDSWITALDQAQQRIKGFRGYPLHFTAEFARLNPQEVLTYVAYDGGEPLAAMIFLLHWPSATYHIGWTGEDGRRTAAHHRILITAAQDFSARGLTCLDLGQIDTQTAPGLARFKLGAGAVPKRLGGTWIKLRGWKG